LLSSAALLTQSLRFDVFPPSRSRALLETARRDLVVEQMPGSRSPSGIKASKDNERAYPWLVGLWWKACSAWERAP